MADDLFSRFKPSATPIRVVDDDSGLAFRSRETVGGAIREVEILTAIDRVPSLPAVVDRILNTVGSEQSSASDLEALIRQDMTLAGRLLKLVNSPFYGLGHPVSSITQAVAIIGFASLKSLVLAASTANLLTIDLSAYGYVERGLWKNSIATAALARAIALRSRASPAAVEEYFVAGLLRDVGVLVLGPFLVRQNRTLRRVDVQEGGILRRERELFGVDHCWVGERVAEKWQLPQRLRLCVARHHRIPPESSPGDLRQLAAVRLAERLTYAAHIGVMPDHPFDARLDSTLISTAGLDPAAFESLVAQVPGIVASSEMTL